MVVLCKDCDSVVLCRVDGKKCLYVSGSENPNCFNCFNYFGLDKKGNMLCNSEKLCTIDSLQWKPKQQRTRYAGEGKNCFYCGENRSEGKGVVCPYLKDGCLNGEKWTLVSQTTQDKTTQDKIEILFNTFKEFLKEKNKRYGDSALNPDNVFIKNKTQDDSCYQIYNRLNDKISRIKNSTELKKNDISDAFGYLALLLIEKGWTEFDDLLD